MQFRALLAAAVLAAASYQPTAIAQSTGLGGYKMCTTTGFTLNGRLGSVLADTFGVTGTGAGECTEDPTGAAGWVPVTFGFVSETQEALPCSTEGGAGAYVLTGPFTINDGSGPVQTDATLTITVAYLDPWTRSITANLDLYDAAMRSSFQVYDVYPPLRSSDPRVCTDSSCPLETQPIQTPKLGDMINPPDGVPVPPVPSTAFWVQFGVDPSLKDSGPLTGAACHQPTIERLAMSGSLDVVLSGLEAIEYAAGSSQAYALLPAEVQAMLPGTAPPLVEAMLPELSAEFENVVEPGVELDPDAALALSEAIDTFTRAFGVSAAGPSLPALVAESAPYLITVKYKTALGSQKMQVLGVMGVASPVLVPNANNSGVPELVLVSIAPTEGAYTMRVERQSNSSVTLPIDVSITVPPAEQLQSLSDITAEVGFEGFSVGGGAPKLFQLSYTSATSDNSSEASARVIINFGTAAVTPLDIVGQYQVASDQTDLALRIRMATSVSNLRLTSIRSGKKRTLTYDADRPVDSISLTGIEGGQQLNARLSNVAKALRFCGDRGNGCVLPWRAYKCGCDDYAALPGSWAFSVCKQPRYCPIAAEGSASFTSTSGSQYSPTTLNLLMHNPTVDSSGTVLSDDVTTVTDLALSQFGFDTRTGDYPKRVYFDTRRQWVSGVFQQATYGKTGARQRLLKVSGGFSASGREFTVKKHRIRFLGHTVGHYYSIDETGSMSCSGFQYNSDFPDWIEDIIEAVLCS